jgi:predicted Zn-dependent peptidase
VAELVDVTLECARRAAGDIDETELARAKAQMKVGLLAALESPGGRIERAARQLLSWGRIIPSDEVVTRVDAVTVEDVREAGRHLLAGAPTLAAVGPIEGLPALERVAGLLLS